MDNWKNDRKDGWKWKMESNKYRRRQENVSEIEQQAMETEWQGKRRMVEDSAKSLKDSIKQVKLMSQMTGLRNWRERRLKKCTQYTMQMGKVWQINIKSDKNGRNAK